MTSTAPDAAGGTLVFDSSPLNHFARADELDTLAVLVEGHRCVTTQAVHQELQRGAAVDARVGNALHLPWLELVATDDLDVLYVFSAYMDKLGHRQRNAGEASVLAWAEVHDATAYVDDQVACNVGRQQNVAIRRTLDLIVSAYKCDAFTEHQAQGLVTNLVQEDARLPQEARDDLFGWARAKGLL